MSELEKRILNTFGRVLPKLSKRGQEKILMIGEGIALGVGAMELEECTSISTNGAEPESDPAAEPTLI